MADRRDPAARAVLGELAVRIKRGKYLPGTWLPTERELSQEFAVQRAVVRAALTDLAESGLITRLPGKRPWVADRPSGANGSHRQRSSGP
ncbi:MAG TPA: winged helix-turn-helix domain-containing protein, partial [Chthonomonadales bacterium]|nr:winged helix-turn-helix domain-containing protein [Chthonomonadales bacterium]